MVDHQVVLNYLEESGVESLTGPSAIRGVREMKALYGGEVICLNASGRGPHTANLTFLFRIALEVKEQPATLKLLEKLSQHMFKGLKESDINGRHNHGLFLAQAFGNHEGILPDERYYPLVEQLLENAFKEGMPTSLIGSIVLHNVMQMQKFGIGDHLPFKPKILEGYRSEFKSLSGKEQDGIMNAFAASSNPIKFLEAGVDECRKGNVDPVSQQEYLTYIGFALLVRKHLSAEDATAALKPLAEFEHFDRIPELLENLNQHFQNNKFYGDGYGQIERFIRKASL